MANRPQSAPIRPTPTSQVVAPTIKNSAKDRPATFKVRIYEQFDRAKDEPARDPVQKDIVSLRWERTVDARASAAKAYVLQKYPGADVTTSHSENNVVVATFIFRHRRR